MTSDVNWAKTLKTVRAEIWQAKCQSSNWAGKLPKRKRIGKLQKEAGKLSKHKQWTIAPKIWGLPKQKIRRKSSKINVVCYSPQKVGDKTREHCLHNRVPRTRGENPKTTCHISLRMTKRSNI